MTKPSGFFSILRYLRQRWQGEGGYLEFLHIAFPLVLSTSAWTVQNSIDRMFLTWYSPAAMAAALPAGMLNYTIMSLCIGTTGYVDVFVAQYYGAKRKRMLGAVIWQGLYLSLLGSVGVMLAAPFSHLFFNWVGHETAIRQHEIVYFEILCWGAFPAIASTALSGFFAGQGKAWTLVWVNTLGTVVNIVFDYVLIFGAWGFPRWGMKGAAIATVLSAVATFSCYVFLIFTPKMDRIFNTLKDWRIQWDLLFRLIRFGVPNGVQLFMDMVGFTIFILIMGNLGTVNLAATNIAFNINTIAFMPMLGSGIAVSVLVGQYLGRNQPKLAERSAYSGFHLCFSYMLVVSCLYIAIPNFFVIPYAAGVEAADFSNIGALVRILLRFVAVYSLFDAMNIIFSGAIKGAGDTKYVMWMQAVVAIFTLALPSYVGLVLLPGGLYTGWTIESIYGIILGVIFLVRFLQGSWKNMRVIEPTV